MTTILIAEDDAHIRRHMRTLLTAQGYNVEETSTMKGTKIVLKMGNIDLLILDLGLPDGDGADLIREIRKTSAMPIVVVSARELESDKVGALDAGADDYLTKPYGADELMARIRAALRHTANAKKQISVYTGNGLRVDTDRHKVTVDGEEIHLTRTEYKIVVLLCENAGRVLRYDAILREIWGDSSVNDTQLLRVNMANIRRKLERDPALPEFITTEIGVGYRMTEMETT